HLSLYITPPSYINDKATTDIYTLSLHDALPIYKSTMKNTGIKAPNKLSPAKLPKGSKILLIIAFKSMFNITLTNQEITIMTIAGTKESKERATETGTRSDILIINPDITTSHIISTANKIKIIDKNKKQLR